MRNHVSAAIGMVLGPAQGSCVLGSDQPGRGCVDRTAQNQEQEQEQGKQVHPHRFTHCTLYSRHAAPPSCCLLLLLLLQEAPGSLALAALRHEASMGLSKFG